MAQVVLKNVNKVFDNGFKAVIDANFATEDKEFVILVGPSGCGKTTTLRMIAGLETATSGDIFIGDRRVNDIPPKDRDIAMVFQNYALYPHMTVYENMAFALRLRKTPPAEIDRHVREAAGMLNVDKLLDRKPKQLSGGQLQRVALGRAIVRHPQVFLFDEPLSNLDAKLRVQMRSEIVKLHRTLETTMIYVTHDQVEAMTMGSKIVVMKDGIIQQIASPLEIYNHPANLFVAGFIGSPAINVVPGKIVEEAGKLWFAFGSHKLETAPEHKPTLEPYRNREVNLGIRPENIYDARYDTLAEMPQRIDATCEIVEPLGNEFIVYFNDPRLTARIDPKEMPHPDKPLKITVDMKKAHYFDPQTEMCVKETC